MKLLIGSTSQISNYFPISYAKISSRNISNKIFDKKYEEAVRIACNFGKHDTICNEQGGNFKMSELIAIKMLSVLKI